MSDHSANSPTARIRVALANERGRLVALVRRYGGAGVDPDDVVQTVAQRALSRSDQLRDGDRVVAWLGRIARNAAIDELRRPRPACEPVELLELDEVTNLGPDCSCVLAQAALLKPAYAEIVRRVDLDGVSVTQVAGELGLSANSAMVRLHRARRALRKQMAEHCGTVSTRSCSECVCMERGCCTLS